MKATKRIAVSMAAVAVVAATPMSAAAQLSGPAAAAMARIEAKVAPIRAEVAKLRTTMAAGTVLSAVRATAQADGLGSVVAAVRPTGPAPATLGQAVRSIRLAVGRARRITRNTAAARMATRITPRRALRLSFELMHVRRAPAAIATPSAAPALRAAAIMATAIDRAMPALKSAAASVPAPAHAATPPGCDLVDQTPFLCVGGPGNNQYDKTESILIDLAGDDTYHNNAGGGVTGPSLSLDLAGNDTYAATGIQATCAQGCGIFGQVGMLVDGAGDDTYSLKNANGLAEGQGLGFFGGAALLVDGTGNDSYTADSTAQGPQEAGAAGQGEGFFAGVAGFVDGGIGDDAYLLRADEIPQVGSYQDDDGNIIPATIVGIAAAAGQGVGGFGGAGLFFESGGADSFRMDVHTEPAPSDGPPVRITRDAVTGAGQQFASTGGQGDAVIGGAAFLLEGPGDTTYTQNVAMDPLPIHDPGVYGQSVGQGIGPAATYGVLSDPSGNDRYDVHVSIASSVSFTATDGCACDGETNAEIGAVTAAVQGYAVEGGGGLLDDAAGNDTHLVDLSNTADLRIDDRRTAAAPQLAGTATAGPVLLMGQGMGGTLGGLGVLSDSSGDDAYAVKASSTAHVAGTAAVGANAPDVLPASGTATLLAQGTGANQGGLGALLDLGGSDSYTASASSSTSIGTGPSVPGTIDVHAQGSVGGAGPDLGVLVDLDGIGADTFIATGEAAACQGTRGQAVWMDCGSYGIGINA